jgi:uncharacterized RDD family membrane protein YckC
MVTVHCLTGCLMGEWIGLAIGVALSLPLAITAVLATVLAYLSGFGLTLWPLLRGGMGFWPALITVFVGEAVSIGVIEVAMNAVDFAMGGMGVKSLFVPRYWEALAVASVAGFLGAWPANFWLLGRNMKKCHHAGRIETSRGCVRNRPVSTISAAPKLPVGDPSLGHSCD